MFKAHFLDMLTSYWLNIGLKKKTSTFYMFKRSLTKNGKYFFFLKR